MKKLMLLLLPVLLLASCAKQDPKDAVDQWNGYENHLKELGVHTLWAGKNINVGTCTYSVDYVDGVPSFIVTYQTITGWTISEAHMYCGAKNLMPRNKPGSPKIGQFLFNYTYNPRVSTITYTKPLSELPSAESGGFVVACHCVVHGPTKTETGWAYGNHKFTDKDWGWYDDITYWTLPVYTVLYGTTLTTDGYLEVYHMNMSTGATDQIVREYVGGTSGTYDASAFDVESGMMFFTKDGDILYVNDMNDDSPSYTSGTLDGVATSATYADGYLYVDNETNNIQLVTFNTDWTKANESTLVTIPDAIEVHDIAMSPDGDYLYIVGTQFDGEEELMSWQVGTTNFYSYSISVDDAQIAFGTDGVLYAIAPDPTGGDADAYVVDTDSGTMTEIDDDDIIIIDDPLFMDLATGMPL